MDQLGSLLQSVGRQTSIIQDAGPEAILAYFLQTVGWTYVRLESLLLVPLITLCFALFPIFTGAYASLSRPNLAAKPSLRPKRRTSDEDDAEENDDEEPATQMEHFGASDAMVIPITAGVVLTSLFFLIKWLDDPKIISTILNWYFAIAGVPMVAKLLTDTLRVAHDFIYPSAYFSGGRVWFAHQAERRFRPAASDYFESSPLPPPFYSIPVPTAIERALWADREVADRRFHLRLYIHKVATISIKFGIFALVSTALALGTFLYSNLVARPWYINNLYGFAFVYISQQLISPSTNSTATLILGALLLYDVYFVFATPVMVTVATTLDIPAMILIPNIGGMSMLGLGDMALPGMVMAWALRFDLWLHYRGLQLVGFEPAEGAAKANGDATTHLHHTHSQKADDTTSEQETSSISTSSKPSPAKPTYYPATGNWGTRFWLRAPIWSSSNTSPRLLGPSFSAPYFHASIIGYTAGLLTATLVMRFSGHPQPALLYIVPAVMVSIWITAYRRGEFKLMWAYDESDEYSHADTDHDAKSKKDGAKMGKENTKDADQDANTAKGGFFARLYREFTGSELSTASNAKSSPGTEIDDKSKEEKSDSQENNKQASSAAPERPKWLPQDRNRLFFFSLRAYKHQPTNLAQTQIQMETQAEVLQNNADDDHDNEEGEDDGPSLSPSSSIDG